MKSSKILINGLVTQYAVGVCWIFLEWTIEVTSGYFDASEILYRVGMALFLVWVMYLNSKNNNINILIFLIYSNILLSGVGLVFLQGELLNTATGSLVITRIAFVAIAFVGIIALILNARLKNDSVW